MGFLKIAVNLDLYSLEIILKVFLLIVCQSNLYRYCNA